MSLLDLLQLETGASQETITRILRTAPRRYKVYTISKRNNKGVRIIAQPARELKVLQRVVLREVLDRIKPSGVAMAYISGRGILKNAIAHQQARWLLKLDFQDFFNSIVPSDWDRAVRRTPELSWTKRDRSDFHNLLFWGRGQNAPRCLSIGAPTSPSVSNLVCQKLDEWLEGEASKRGLTITRYADDITVSGPNLPAIRKFEAAFEGLLDRNRGINLRLNPEKRGLYGPGEKRMITGLVLTPEGNISLGRDRKREIHSLVNSCKVGIADEETWMRAKGLLSFAKMVEGIFFESLIRKYGEPVIREIASFDPVQVDSLEI